ncbi:MAG TPA: PaaI family thioesterase [Clostridia bacterium]|nr:PaaI family thioesterase [Clostridia bacterium]
MKSEAVKSEIATSSTKHAPEGAEASMCFGCGSDNPWGLKLDFRDEGVKYVAEFTPRAEYQGYPGILHGGIVCTLLDESMARMLWSRGMKLPTGKLEVRFRRPARLDGHFRVEAFVSSQEGRIISCSSVLKDLTRDEVVAEGRATFLVPPQMALKAKDDNQSAG